MGITTTKSFSIVGDEIKDEIKKEAIDVETYLNVKHVKNVFEHSFNRLKQISKEMRKLSDEAEEIVKKCQDRSKKFLRV